MPPTTKRAKAVRSVTMWALARRGTLYRWSDGTPVLYKTKAEAFHVECEPIKVEIRPAARRRKGGRK